MPNDQVRFRTKLSRGLKHLGHRGRKQLSRYQFSLLKRAQPDQSLVQPVELFMPIRRGACDGSDLDSEFRCEALVLAASKIRDDGRHFVPGA